MELEGDGDAIEAPYGEEAREDLSIITEEARAAANASP